MKALKKIVRYFFWFFPVVLLTACPKPQQYPDEPQITFKQFILSDTVDLLGNDLKRLSLRFYLVDGDGNIGLKDGDTTGIFHTDSLYNNNFFTSIYEIINGDTVSVDEEYQRNFRIPYIEPQGQLKTLMADIYTDIDFSFQQNGELPYDSIYIEFYIVDRDFNISNVEHSPVIKLDTLGKFPDLVVE
jgi:hypothetical protein